jgi:DNA-binding HxlR family transcriptional regulator
VDATARIVSGKWTIVLLRDLASGPRRFSELERSLDGISTRTLSVRLKTLCEAGIVERAAAPDGGGSPAYVLTEQGECLLPVIDAMRTFGTRFLVDEPVR